MLFVNLVPPLWQRRKLILQDFIDKVLQDLLPSVHVLKVEGESTMLGGDTTQVGWPIVIWPHRHPDSHQAVNRLLQLTDIGWTLPVFCESCVQ